MTDTTGPVEVSGLDQSIAYAEHLAAEAGLHSPAGNEGYLTRLATARVTGDGLTTGSDMQQAFAGAAAAAGAHAEELAKQKTVQQAYDAAPDAGDKAYQTGGASNPDSDQAKEAPVTEEDDCIDPVTGMTQKDLAAFRDYNQATGPFLNRRTEQQRIEAEHDARAELVDQGRRTAQWHRTAAAVLNARTQEIDRMVAALRPGDQVRQADDPDGTVWTVRDVRDGNDRGVRLSLLRTREDGTEVGAGCLARGVDLVAAATDDEHAAMVKAELASDLRNKWITQAEYDVALTKLTARNTGASR
jgi:hypothetical protein